MKYYCLLLLGFIMLSANKCDQPTNQTGQALNEVFALEHNKVVSIAGEDLKISFTKVEDSRCPKKTECVWAGKATITLNIEKDGNTEMVDVEVKGLCYDKTGKCGETKTAMGYQFKINQVNPYPESSTVKPEDLVVELVITK